MEDILDLYACPEDPEHPVVCVDETSKQHLQQTRPPLRLTVGKPYRYDSEYKRNGVSNLFMIFAPLDGFRHVEVTDQRRSIDFAHICRDIVVCISQTQKRFCWFAIISIHISRLPCIKPLIHKNPGGSLKNLSFTIPRSTGVG